MNRIHEKPSRIVYKDNILSFEKSGLVSIHHRNIQLIAIEIQKALNNLSSPLMAELFKIYDSNYDLRKADGLVSNKPIISPTYGIGSIAHLYCYCMFYLYNLLGLQNQVVLSIFIVIVCFICIIYWFVESSSIKYIYCYCMFYLYNLLSLQNQVVLSIFIVIVCISFV